MTDQNIIVERHYIPISLYRELYHNNPPTTTQLSNNSQVNRSQVNSSQVNNNNNHNINNEEYRRQRREYPTRAAYRQRPRYYITRNNTLLSDYAASFLQRINNSSSNSSNQQDNTNNNQDSINDNNITNNINISMRDNQGNEYSYNIDDSRNEDVSDIFNNVFNNLLSNNTIRRQNDGLTQEELHNNTTTREYEGNDDTNNSDDNNNNETNNNTTVETCSICRDEYNDSDEIRLLNNCGHEFHSVCIDEWLLTHRTCPICRANVV